ncbi:MAG: HupE/UreJ family protein [Cyanobium sp.]
MAATALLLLGGMPAQAHGIADAGLLGGVLHPLFGLDHLCMLMAVGAAASFLSSPLLLWALGGALLGAAFGFGGSSLPAAELLAALAISAVALVTLQASRPGRSAGSMLLPRLAGPIVAAGMAVHALLHGLEAPRDGSTLLWWGGALLSSALVSGVACLALRRLPGAWTRFTSLALLVAGAVLATATMHPG